MILRTKRSGGTEPLRRTWVGDPDTPENQIFVEPPKEEPKEEPPEDIEEFEQTPVKRKPYKVPPLEAFDPEYRAAMKKDLMEKGYREDIIDSKLDYLIEKGYTADDFGPLHTSDIDAAMAAQPQGDQKERNEAFINDKMGYLDDLYARTKNPMVKEACEGLFNVISRLSPEEKVRAISRTLADVEKAQRRGRDYIYKTQGGIAPSYGPGQNFFDH